MIRDSALREVVCADTLGAVSRSYLAPSVSRDLIVLLLYHFIVKSGLEYSHGLLSVLDLGLFVLACYHDARRQVGHTDRGVCGVYALAAVSGCSVNINLNIVRVDLNLNVVDFRKNRNSCSRSVDTAGRLSLRHSLHSVDSGLELESRVCAAAFDHNNSFLDSADSGIADLDNLCLPVAALSVSQIHSEKIVSEESCLFAACAGSDLKDNVLVIVRVLREKKNLELFLSLLHSLFEILGFLFCHLTHFLVILEVNELSGVCEIALHFTVAFISPDYRLYLGHLLHVLLPCLLVCNDSRVSDLLGEFLIFLCNKV